MNLEAPINPKHRVKMEAIGNARTPRKINTYRYLPRASVLAWLGSAQGGSKLKKPTEKKI